MKGIVFTEFLEMVEGTYSTDMVDRIIAQADVPSGGAYTAVGTYDGAEMVKLAVALGEATKTPVPKLLESFGRHLFGRFVLLYPDFFRGCRSSFDFLPRVDGYIHREVRKLYPDADLPSIKARQIDPDTLAVTYSSPRCLATLARGLIEGCVAHFKDPLSVSETAGASVAGSQLVTFTLRRCAA
jgi:hypothetical protein